MQVYEKYITVNKNDLDELNHVNNVRYVQWIQDIAKAHWEQNTTKNIRDSFFWVVVNHFIEYKSPVEMHKNDKLLVKAETVWCLLSVSTNRPARITEEIKSLFVNS